MTEFERDRDALEPFFKAVREAEPPAPGPDVLARVLAAAEAELDARTAPAPRPAVRRQGGAFATFLRAIGGWPAMAGLAAATFAGVFVGIVQPAALSDQVSPWLSEYGLSSAAEDDFSLDPGAVTMLSFAAIEG